MRQEVGTVVAVYLAAGFLIGFALFGWIVVLSVRRHGFRNAVRGAARAYAEELPMYWRVPVVGWMFVIALPLIAVWTSVKGNWDPVGAVFVGLLWLLYLALLRWHYRAKARGRGTPRRRTGA
jgi:membrane associated rhomboid family serine protease